MRALRDIALGAGFACCVVALWYWVAAQRLVSPVYLPGPGQVLTALWRGLWSGTLAAKLGATVLRMVVGWLLASLVGVAVGLAVGLAPRLRPWVQPSLEFLRPLPASAMVPVAIALFGLSDGMVLAVIAFGAIWPVLLGTVHGCAGAEPRLVEVASLLRLTRRQVAWKIVIPSAMPDILSGMQIGLSIALILTIVGEMLGGRDGLGYWILLAARNFHPADLYAGVVLLALVGCLGSLSLAWIPSARGRPADPSRPT